MIFYQNCVKQKLYKSNMSLLKNPEQAGVRIGGVVFSKTVEQMLPLAQQIEQTIQNRIFWHLYSKKYTKQKWSTIMQHIQQIQTTQLQLSDNDYPPIIKQISLISFPTLTNLSLVSNRIRSIQCLSRIPMPLLSSLHLCRNEIVRVRPLRKVMWPKLRVLVINDNPFTDASQTFSECYFPQLQFVILQAWSDSPVFLPSSSQLLKCQPKIIKYININSQQRISQLKIEGQLQQKYTNIRINVDEQQ